MLRIDTGRSSAFCDGICRRSFLQIGALGFAGLTLADLLQAEEKTKRRSEKAIINIHLSGGPSHQDMFDLKPESPAEFRGEFNPISTNVPGIEICEHFPLLAKMADKYALIRTLVGSVGDHANYQTHTGFRQNDLRNVGGRPALGSVVAKLLGETATGAPSFISYNGGDPGFLGPVYKPFKPDGGSLRMSRGLDETRLDARTNLLSQLDNLRRDIDASGQMEALDSYTARAVEVITSGKVADALDLKKEDPAVVERYGRDGRNFLLSRRLVEAGVRTVTFSYGGWDTHGKNFDALRRLLPKLDTALSALIGDLHDRGLDQDVTVIVWGEFGRTPRVNRSAGRDHWPKLSMAFLAGGGMRMGQAIGVSSKFAEEPLVRPVHFQEVFATLYHTLGINVASTTIDDPNGRPQYLVDIRRPIEELI